MVPAYTFISYERLQEHIGRQGRMLRRLPTGRLLVDKGKIVQENTHDPNDRNITLGKVFMLLSEDEYYSGIVIQPADRVYVKNLPQPYSF
ncbi:MAG TPA: hypothetical protein VJH04_00865 [archaeon]|nr:hypothetical protein [archaeon]